MTHSRSAFGDLAGRAGPGTVGLLARHAPGGQTEYVVRQGKEMGRPSFITIQLRKDNDVLTHGGIGGHAVIVGEGALDIGD